MEHDERYRRAREFYDVVTGLWDSFADDAFVRDVEAASFSTRRGCMCWITRASTFRVRGPLNIARPLQGWPVIVQAGASEAGKQLAAETAEAVFAAGGSLADGPEALCRHQGPHGRLGRDRNDLKILPGAFVVVGDRVEEAREKRARSTAWCITTAPSPRSRSSSAPTPPASTPTGRCRQSRKPTPARAAASGWSTPPPATS